MFAINIYIWPYWLMISSENVVMIFEGPNCYVLLFLVNATVSEVGASIVMAEIGTFIWNCVTKN